MDVISCKALNGEDIQPYIVGDAAFALRETIMKCYDNPIESQDHAFNSSVMRTRRVVEQAFGRLKARFHVLVSNNFTNLQYAARVTMFCCALHNICERQHYPFERSWCID